MAFQGRSAGVGSQRARSRVNAGVVWVSRLSLPQRTLVETAECVGRKWRIWHTRPVDTPNASANSPAVTPGRICGTQPDAVG